MYVRIVSIFSRKWINRVRLTLLLRSRLRIWSRETGSADPSRVSLLILHTQAESGSYSRDSSRFQRRRPNIPSTAIGSVLSSSWYANAYRWRSLPRVVVGTGSVVPKVVPVTGAAILGYRHGPIDARLSFPTPTIIGRFRKYRRQYERKSFLGG